MFFENEACKFSGVDCKDKSRVKSFERCLKHCNIGERRYCKWCCRGGLFSDTLGEMESVFALSFNENWVIYMPPSKSLGKG